MTIEEIRRERFALLRWRAICILGDEAIGDEAIAKLNRNKEVYDEAMKMLQEEEDKINATSEIR